eukprot:SAG25_NODE_241_length_11184_cov_4.090934_16_plen_105_part_00
MAYLQSAADSTFEVPVMYPKGYEMTGDDGESLLAVLQKPLYGHPEAARAWSDTRNAWMAEKFNQDGWTAKLRTKCRTPDNRPQKCRLSAAGSDLLVSGPLIFRF